MQVVILCEHQDLSYKLVSKYKVYSLLLLFAHPPKFRQVLQNNCKTKGVGGRKIRDVITHLLAFLSCLCLHSSVDGHQLEKKLQRN